MAKIFRVVDEEERGFDDKYNQRGHEEEGMLERAFKEGCEHGYKKAMREMEEYHERGGKMSHRVSYKEGFEEKIEKLKRKYE